MRSTGSMHTEFQYLSSASQYWGDAQVVGDFARSRTEFDSIHSMLDLGGAAGFFSIAIAAARPMVIGDIIEPSRVGQLITWEYLRQYEMTARISVTTSNCLADAPRKAYDLVVAGNPGKTMNLRRSEFLRNVADALNPGGIFLTYQDGAISIHAKSDLWAERTMCATAMEKRYRSRFLTSVLAQNQIIHPTA